MLKTDEWGGLVKLDQARSPQGEQIMKVVALRNIMVQGKPILPGEEIDLPEKDAKYLAKVGKVRLKTGAAAKSKKAAADEGESDEGEAGDEGDGGKETAESKQAKGREKR